MPANARAERIIAEATPDWVRDEPGTTTKPKLLRELRVTRADTIAPTRITWLWPGWVPKSRLALFGGKPGDGKSTVALDLAARLSTASPMPDGSRPNEPINVAILSAEDGPSDTIIPRLIVAGANLERVYIVGGIISDIGIERPWILPDDILELANFVHANSIGLLVIDPLSAFQSANVDTHRDGAVRAMLLPLSNMASDLNCAVIAVRHHRKGGASDARDAGSGSIAFTAAARIEWTAGSDPNNNDLRILAVAKSNIAAVPQSLAYSIGQDDQYETNQIHWQGISDVTASELTGERQSDEERSELNEAIDFLNDVLSNGPIESKKIKALAKDADIAERTLRRAKDKLRVKVKKSASGPWIWELREPVQAQVEDVQTTRNLDLGHLGHLGHVSSSHTLSNEGFTREAIEGVQDVQESESQEIWTSSAVDDDYIESLIDQYEGDAS